jgi:SCY1-like protein 2
MFAAATSFFSRTAISQSYNIGGTSTSSRSGTPTPSGSSTPVPVVTSAPFNVGLWRIQAAVHKVTNKPVSVWSFDKRGSDMERMAPLVRDTTLEVLKSEVYSRY